MPVVGTKCTKIPSKNTQIALETHKTDYHVWGLQNLLILQSSRFRN